MKTSSALHLELALPRKNLTSFYDHMRRNYEVAANLEIFPRNRPLDVEVFAKYFESEIRQIAGDTDKKNYSL